VRPPKIDRPPRQFVFVCRDGPDAAGRRSAAIAAHTRYMETVWRRISVAGPLHDPADGTVVGSLYLVAAVDAAEAWSLLRDDPFFSAGIWQDIRLSALTPALGAWVGGRIWD